MMSRLDIFILDLNFWTRLKTSVFGCSLYGFLVLKVLRGISGHIIWEVDVEAKCFKRYTPCFSKWTPLHLHCHTRESAPRSKSGTVSVKASEIRCLLSPRGPPGSGRPQRQWNCRGHLPFYLRWARGYQYPRSTFWSIRWWFLFQETIAISWYHRIHLFPLVKPTLSTKVL